MTVQGLAGAAAWLGRAVAAVAAAMLAAWAVSPDLVDRGVLTRPLTASALLLLGATVGWPWLPAVLRWVALAWVAVVGVGGVVVLGWADQPGGVGPASALCLLLLVTALPLVPRRPTAATVLTVGAFGMGFVGAVGHLYGVTALFNLQSATAMAAPTAVVVLGLSLAVLLADPRLPLFRALRAPGTAGALVRRLLVWTLLLPPVTGWLVVQATGRRWVDDAYGLSVMALATSGGAVLLVVIGARTAARTDHAREVAARDLAVVNAELTDRVEAAVADAEAGRDRLRFLLDSTPVGIFELGPDGTPRFANQRWRDLAGLDDVGEDWSLVLQPEDRDRVRQAWGAALASGDEFSTRCRYVRVTGGVSWVDINAVAERGADGEVTRWLGSAVDVTDQVEATAALRRSEEQTRLAMAHAPIGMALVEVDGTFREVNRALCRLVGYDEEELVGRTFQQITHPDDLEADLDNIRHLLDGSLDHYSMEKRYLTRDGDVVWVLLAVSLAHDELDRPAYFIAQIQDITDARAAQQRLEHRALHDPLTGLPNRDLLMDRLSHSLARGARGGTSTAVMFCDLDRFKSVNDTYGHEAGDQLLVAVADRLREVTRPGDTVARLGGDEFVVVVEGVRDLDAVRALAERVRRAMAEPVRVGTRTVRTDASIGVAVAAAEDDARSVLREADAAMYRAKALGRGRLEVSQAADRPAPLMALVRRSSPSAAEADQHPA